MIGVITNPEDHDVVCEFFELFKTPWEFYRRDSKYDVVLCAGNDISAGWDSAKLVIFYAGRKLDVDEEQGIAVRQHSSEGATLSYQGCRIPIYGQSIGFSAHGTTLLINEESQECTACLIRSGGRVLARIGYDLLSEIRALLTAGQPPKYASIPTLELHIAFLRDLIVMCGIPLVEIPPIPDGYRLIACLTHDVDDPFLRRHRWDHTLLGFLYRSSLGSLLNLARGRMSLGELLGNWMAVWKLPLVHLGLAKDCWSEFADRYMELERDCKSTFFVIPFENRPGRVRDDLAPAWRAARYAARDLAETTRKLASRGHEIGLHGIDAWLDIAYGREELEEIRQIAQESEIGVRMHWLYYDQQSPTVLEEAGAEYDSTVGYNNTVGYRAGTTQVYKPLAVARLLELPLHVMDTALFFPTYLGLSPDEAFRSVKTIIDNAGHFGGTVTVNWHDRSIAPERWWNECYRQVVEELRNRGAWLATGREAANWFRKRRSVVFKTDPADASSVRVQVARCDDNLPGLRMRIHNSGEPAERAHQYRSAYIELPFQQYVEATGGCCAAV
jgi:peptidoglycan/xylan/chitin deacetylase (PgdA/CDA1 family)